jgi:hypothetical protein
MIQDDRKFSARRWRIFRRESSGGQQLLERRCFGGSHGSGLVSRCFFPHHIAHG